MNSFWTTIQKNPFAQITHSTILKFYYQNDGKSITTLSAGTAKNTTKKIQHRKRDNLTKAWGTHSGKLHKTQNRIRELIVRIPLDFLLWLRNSTVQCCETERGRRDMVKMKQLLLAKMDRDGLDNRKVGCVSINSARIITMWLLSLSG